MKWTEQQQLENESRIAFRSILPRNWIVRDQTPDVGVDLEIELVKGVEVDNKLLWVQLKATESTEMPSTEISFLAETKHLKYYESARIPVAFILWRKKENAFYFIFAQKYISEVIAKKDPKWKNKKTKVVIFDTKSKLINSIALEALANEGYFYIIEKQLKAQSGGGSTVYWLGGLPKSDNKELVERTLKALTYLTNGNYSEAITEFENLNRVCIMSPEDKMANLFSLGNAYYLSWQHELALKNFEAILELAKKVDDKIAIAGEASALNNIGLIQAIRGNLESAINLFEKSFELSKSVSLIEVQNDSLINQSSAYLTQGKLQQALEITKKAIVLARGEGDRINEVIGLNNLGLICKETGNIDDALALFKSSLAMSKEIDNGSGQSRALNNIGLIYALKGDYKKALDMFSESLQIDRKIGDKQGEADALCNLGLTLGILGKYEQEIENLENSIKLCRLVGYQLREVIALSTLGLVYASRGKEVKALKYCIDALCLMDKLQLKNGRQDIERTIEKLTARLQQSKV